MTGIFSTSRSSVSRIFFERLSRRTRKNAPPVATATYSMPLACSQRDMLITNCVNAGRSAPKP